MILFVTYLWIDVYSSLRLLFSHIALNEAMMRQMQANCAAAFDFDIYGFGFKGTLNMCAAVAIGDL